MGQSTLCLNIAKTLSSEASQCCKDSINPCKRMEITGQGTSVFLPSPPEYFGGAVNSLKESSMTPILKTSGWMVMGRKGWTILLKKKNSYVLHVAQYFSLFLPIGPHRSRTYSAWMKLITTQTCAFCFCYFHLKLHSAICSYYTSSFYFLAASLYILCCKPNHPLIVWVAPYCSTMYILVAILSATAFHGISHHLTERITLVL